MFDQLQPQTKQIIKILALLIITVSMGIGLFLLFTSKPLIETPVDTGDDQTTTPGGIPVSQDAQERPTQDDEQEGGGLVPSPVADGGPTFVQTLTSTSITEPTLIDGSGIMFYNAQDGRFYKIDESGEMIAVSDARFPQAETIVIAESADIAAIEFPDGSNIIYDFATEEQTTLPSHWEEFGFTSDGEEVAAKSLTNDITQNALVVTSSDGSQTQVLAPLGENESKVEVNWSTNDQIVGFSNTGATALGFGRYEIYLIGNDGEESGHLIVEGSNFSAKWSPTSQTILYSVAYSAKDDRPSLWIANGTGDIGSERQNLGIETWVEKCAFKTETSIVCAVPNEVTDGSGIDHRLIESGDSIYEINLETGSTKYLGSPVLETQMSNLVISDDNSILYFTDEYGRLNYMRLK